LPLGFVLRGLQLIRFLSRNFDKLGFLLRRFLSRGFLSGLPVGDACADRYNKRREACQTQCEFNLDAFGAGFPCSDIVGFGR
jgi:hypothetical protein